MNFEPVRRERYFAIKSPKLSITSVSGSYVEYEGAEWKIMRKGQLNKDTGDGIRTLGYVFELCRIDSSGHDLKTIAEVRF